MTDRELKQRIKSAFPIPKAERKEEFLAKLGSRQGERTRFWGKAPAMSRRRFYLTQFGYIRKRIWLLSALLLAAAVEMTNFFRLVRPDIDIGKGILWSVSAVVPLLAVLVVVEMNRSFCCGMNELEMSTRHNLTEIYLARMVFLGAGNFLWMLLALFLFARESQEVVFMLIVYLMVPYLLATVLSLEISAHSRRETVLMSSVAVACAVSASYGILCGIVDIYDARYQSFWTAGFLVLLYLTGKKMVGMKTIWEEQLCSLD